MSTAGRSHAKASLPAAAKPQRPWPLAPLATQLEQAIDAERTLAARYDAETLHLWRVQLRRLIAAADGLVRLPPAAPEADAALAGELKALRQRTGGSRDLDVLLDATLPDFVARKPDHRPDPALLAALESRREQARQQTLEIIAGAGLRPLQARLLAQLEQRLAAIALPSPALAAALLDARLHKLHRRCRRFRDSPRKLHRLRTAAKDLNYTLTLGEGLLDAAAATAWSETAGALQRQLGRAHDLLAGGELLATLGLEGNDGRFAKRFRRWCERRADKLADKAADTAKKLQALDRFWR